MTIHKAEEPHDLQRIHHGPLICLIGTEFISYSEGIDTSTPAGQMVFTFLAAVAEFERSLIQERVRDGIARATKAEGVVMGRPKMELDVAKVMGLRDDGLSLREIARQTVTRGSVQNLSHFRLG